MSCIFRCFKTFPKPLSKPIKEDSPLNAKIEQVSVKAFTYHTNPPIPGSVNGSNKRRVVIQSPPSQSPEFRPVTPNEEVIHHVLPPNPSIDPTPEMKEEDSESGSECGSDCSCSPGWDNARRAKPISPYRPPQLPSKPIPELVLATESSDINTFPQPGTYDHEILTWCITPRPGAVKTPPVRLFVKGENIEC